MRKGMTMNNNNMLSADDREFLTTLTKSIIMTLLLTTNKTTLGVAMDRIMDDAEYMMKYCRDWSPL